MHINLILAIIAIYGLSISQAAVIKPTNNVHRKNRLDKNPWNLWDSLTAASGIRTFNGTWITDNEFHYTAADRSIRKFNAALNKDTVFITSNYLKIYKYFFPTYTFSPHNTKILVRYNAEGTFGHSSLAKCDIFDIVTQKSLKIHNGEKLQYCAWSPIKDRLVYVHNNNVFIHSGENLEVQITSDGINDILYNGIPDWVYAEEVLNSGSALWWSQDGNFLAVGVFNDTNVKTFKYFLYGEVDDNEYQYPKEVDLKYPKPGTNNPVVTIKVFNLTSNPSYVTIKAPVEVVSKYHILKSVDWTSDRKLLITWLNRRQNVASLQLCKESGACQEVKRIEEPKGWIDIENLSCLKSTPNCLFTYWIDNWYQIWNLNLVTGENEWHSRGNFTVLNVYGYDESNDRIYYQATLNADPSVSHVFRNSDCLTCNLIDEDGAKCHSAEASFSQNYSYYSVTCGGPNPNFSKVFLTRTNTLVKDWELNTKLRAQLKTKLMPTVEIMQVPLGDDSMGMAKVLFPPHLDKSKKYSMIVYVYGDPNSVRVNTEFGVDFAAYMTTNHDVIYVLIDGRGTGNKGKDLLFSVNNHLGEFEVEDQIYVTKYLQKKFPFVDKDRCAIWGWSYGGYITARTLANDTDRVFQCGISVAPVTSWLYYDSIYTERYMGLPADNLEKYSTTSVWHNVNNFRNHSYLLIHGSADDNVHYQHSLMFAKVLEENDMFFEQMTYTDENHSIGNLDIHLYHNMIKFLTTCLNLNANKGN